MSVTESAYLDVRACHENYISGNENTGGSHGIIGSMADKLLDITKPSQITPENGTGGPSVKRHRKFSTSDEQDGAFFVVNLKRIEEKMTEWRNHLPGVEPFYAVKCNPDDRVLRTLANLGAGFDCASRDEIAAVLALEHVGPERIIYAHPCKQKSFIRYAASRKVHRMTFDNSRELDKIKSINPNARLVLRILPPKTDKVQCVLGNKFGCSEAQVEPLLLKAKQLNLNVIGISFHVGSGCYDAKVYGRTIELCDTFFNLAEKIGFHFTLLDIGGGFPGSNYNTRITFQEIAEVLRTKLDEFFPPSRQVRIIAEPGRMMVATAFTLCTKVISVRDTGEEKDERPMYYLNDGVYGSFNCIMYDHATIIPVPLKTYFRSYENEPLVESTLWGPTCDGLDCISEGVKLPRLNCDDWIIFPEMGAYTNAAGSSFNGMPKPKVYYNNDIHRDTSHVIKAAVSNGKCIPPSGGVPNFKERHVIPNDTTIETIMGMSSDESREFEDAPQKTLFCKGEQWDFSSVCRFVMAGAWPIS